MNSKPYSTILVLEVLVNLDPSLLQNVSPLAIILVFFGGILTSIGPCNVAMIPLVIGYVGGRKPVTHRRAFVLSLTFVIGLALTFVGLGVIATLVGGMLGGTSRIWYYVVAAVCFFVGVQMLAGFDLPQLPGVGRLRERLKLKGVPGALSLGLVSGLVASQCATPFLAAILTYVMARQGALVYGAGLLFSYALGRGVPIVLAGTFTGIIRSLESFTRWTQILEKASAILILGVGLYFLWIA
ncbi:MAG: cytochrome c biogenesis protein CcdA [Anaerolineales bacterium]|nr:MAG: cytochrome c biogenesis protein CcdA [Anaerolineales bacterium]